MAPALISTPVLAAKPVANCDSDSYIDGLLDELAQKRDAIPVVPGRAVSLEHTAVMELRGVISELIIAVRNERRARSAY